MDISRRYVDIGNQIKFKIHRPVVEIKEPLRLAVANHIAAFRVGGTHFNFLGFAHFLSFFQGFFPCALRSSVTASLSSSI